MESKYKLILASASPRRKELLSYLKLPFKVMSSGIDEVTDKLNPPEVVVDLAKLKAIDIKSKNQESNVIIISADTIVVNEGQILGKPKNIEDAKSTLLNLSGGQHEVLTGVCIVLNEKVHTFYCETKVRFKKINIFELNLYLDSKDSMDKAGAYGVQGQAQIFIESINGSYSNVVGLPIAELMQELKNILGKEDLKALFY